MDRISKYGIALKVYTQKLFWKFLKDNLYMMEYCSCIHRYAYHSSKWITLHLDNIMLNEVSQRKRDSQNVLSHMWNIIKKQYSGITKFQMQQKQKHENWTSMGCMTLGKWVGGLNSERNYNGRGKCLTWRNRGDKNSRLICLKPY